MSGMSRMRWLIGLALTLGATAGTSAQSPAAAGAAAAVQTGVVDAMDIAGAEVRGPESAAVTVVIFADADSPATAPLGAILHGLTNVYGDVIRIAFRHHPDAERAASMQTHVALAAAASQHRFWEMLDLVLANQGRHTHDDFVGMAAQLELDVTRFTADLEAPAGRARIDADQQQAAVLKVTATPTFVINGQRLAGPKTLAQLRRTIDRLLPPAP